MDEFDEYLEMDIRHGLSMESVPVGELYQALEKEFRGELADAGVALEVSCDCPGERLLCNYPYLRRYFGNLISNSINHAGTDRLALQIMCHRHGSMLCLSFQDNGKGVPPEQIFRLTEPFYTSDRGRKVSGLGLSICASIAAAHGGRLIVKNAEGGGLEGTALLPRAEE